MLPNEELRSANIRMLKDLQDVEKQNALLTARVAVLERARAAGSDAAQSLLVRSLQAEVEGLRAAQDAANTERDAAFAAQHRRARELASAMEEAAQVRKDSVASLNDAHTVFTRELGERSAELAALRTTAAELRAALEAERQRSQAAAAAAAAAIKRAEQAEALPLVSVPHPPPASADACLSPVKALAPSSSQDQADVAAAAIAAAGAARAAAEAASCELSHTREQLRATRADLTTREARAAERDQERERACSEREAASAGRERLAVVMAQRARAAEAVATEKCGQMERQYEVLNAMVASLRRQLAETVIERRGPPQGTQFQQFVALKREIAILRATNASLTRTDGRAGSASAVAALPNGEGAASHGGSTGSPLTSPFTPSFTPPGGPAGSSVRPGSCPGSKNSLGFGGSCTNICKPPSPEPGEGKGAVGDARGSSQAASAPDASALATAAAAPSAAPPAAAGCGRLSAASADGGWRRPVGRPCGIGGGSWSLPARGKH
jgi:hypothetical protein